MPRRRRGPGNLLEKFPKSDYAPPAGGLLLAAAVYPALIWRLLPPLALLAALLVCVFPASAGASSKSRPMWKATANHCFSVSATAA